MNLRQLLALAAAASLLVPGTALAGKGNGKPAGKPQNARTISSETVEEAAPVTTTPEITAPVVTAPVTKKPKKNAAKKAAKKACKGLSKKHVKGKKGTPFSRCIVAAAKRLAQPTEPVDQTPVEPAPVEQAPVEPAPPVEQPTEPVQTTDPVEAPIA